MKYSIYQNYLDRDGRPVNIKEFGVREHNRTYTGVRWQTIQNWVDEFDTLEEALKKYPTAKVYRNEIS